MEHTRNSEAPVNVIMTKSFTSEMHHVRDSTPDSQPNEQILVAKNQPSDATPVLLTPLLCNDDINPYEHDIAKLVDPEILLD
jgi:hypothetical protein